jgi:nucleoside permease NupC
MTKDKRTSKHNLLFTGWFGDLAGVEILLEDGTFESLTLEYILGKIFIPVAFVMGVPADETELVGRLIGVKIMINEFVAYDQLGKLVAAGAISKRAETISTFALCGFANVGSIGVQIGGLGALAPSRKADLAKVALRAFVAGCFASFLNASIAGMLISSI